MTHTLTLETTAAQEKGLALQLEFLNRQAALVKQPPITADDFLLRHLSALAQRLGAPIEQQSAAVLTAALDRAPKDVQDAVKLQLGLAADAESAIVNRES